MGENALMSSDNVSVEEDYRSSASRSEIILRYTLGHFTECTTFFLEVDNNANAALGNEKNR